MRSTQLSLAEERAVPGHTLHLRAKNLPLISNTGCSATAKHKHQSYSYTPPIGSIYYTRRL